MPNLSEESSLYSRIIEEGDIKLIKVHTHDNIADPLTKALPCTKHVDHASSIRLRPASSPRLQRRAIGIDQDNVIKDDIMESVISCETAKATWTDLVHSFEGPSDTKENRSMDLKIEYQTFRAKPFESLSKTYTHYKNFLNELANDGVNLSKHEINVGFMNSLPEKWLTFSQGLRNANHTQTLDLADIYRRFVYEDNQIQRRYSDTKKALITTPSSTSISTAFFSNNVVHDFQENSDDEVDERSSEEYLRDLDIEFHERSLLANSKRFIKRRNNFSSQKSNENTKCFKCGKKCHFAKDWLSKTSKPSYKSPSSSSQANPKVQKDYKAEYKKMKAKLALLEDEEEVSDDEEVTQVKVLMALADDELSVRKNHAGNEQLKEEEKINEKWLTSLKKVSQCISEQIPHQKNKVHGGDLLTESLSKINLNENVFIPASMDYDHEMVPKSKDWVKRLNPDSKLPNFNTGRILVPKNQAVNESLKPTEASTDPESSKASKAESLTPLPPLKILQGASPSSEVMSLTFQPHSPKERSGLGIMKHTKPETQDFLNKSVSGTVTVSEIEPTTTSVPTEVKNTEQESNINELTKLDQMLIDKKDLKYEMYTALLKRSENYKAQPYQYASPSKQILKAKAKPFSPCTHCGFNDHRPDDCRNYPNVMHVEALYTPPLTTMNPITLKERHIKEPIWYLDSGYSRSMTGVKSYLHKYVEQPGPKVVFGDNSSCITKGYGSINQINHLGKFDAKAGDGYLLGYSFNSKAFRVFKTRRQQIEETYHVIFDENDPSRKYQSNFDISCYIIPHGRSLTELAQEKHVPEGIALNESDIPHTEDAEGPPDLINTKGTHEQNDRWSKDQHIELVNIIGDPGEGMLTRSMDPKLTACRDSKYLLRLSLSKIDLKSGKDGSHQDIPCLCYIHELHSSEFPDYVCKLDKALYGLEQAPRAWLDYAKGTYVSHPSPEVVKAELAKIVLGGKYSSTEQVNSIHQLIAYCLLTGTKVDIGEISYSHLVTRLTNKSRQRYVSYPRFVSCALAVLLGPDYTQVENFGSSPTILSNSNFSKDPSKVTPIELTAFVVAVNNRKHLVTPLPFTVKKKKGKSQTMTSTLPQSQGP
ncbi:hypothetical protein Tco_0115342 [Tanacetum coccineum]